MRGFAFTTLLLLSAVLTGCVGEDASEIIDDTTPEIISEDERSEDTTRVEKEDCEERGGTWTEAPDREGESYCDFDDVDDREDDDSEITQEDCEERGGTWDEQTRDCSFPEERPEEEQEPEPTYIPSCNVTASQGMNSTANPENWPELQSGKWNDIEGLTQISYATPVDDTEAIVDTRLDWMCGYTYSVRPPSDYNDSKQYPIFIFLHGGVTNDWFFTNFLTNNFHIPQDDSYIIVRPSKLEMDWNPKKVLDVLEDVKTQMSVDDDRVYLTGLSMGGRGTFIVAAELPDYFAAIMPLSPHHTPYSYLPLAEDVAHLPIWMSHGDSDNTSSYDLASQMAQELQDLGAEIEFHTVIGGEHGGWFSIYSDPVVMEWMLSHVRGQ
jgi:predicted esterase